MKTFPKNIKLTVSFVNFKKFLAVFDEFFGFFFRKQKVIPTKVTYGQAQQCSCHSTAVKIEKCPVTDFRGKLHFFCQSEKCKIISPRGEM